MFTGSKTEQNLLKAFAGESQARNRYDYAAGVARKEGYEQIAEIFETTAENERIHAKNFFRFLEGGMVEITAAYPGGVLGTTAENLLAAANGELEEHSELYPEFARVAREEGFTDAARQFELTAKVEVRHEARFRALLKRVEEGTVHKRETPAKWVCRKCGYVAEGKSAPETCPACKHPKGYFEESAENY